MIHQAAHRLARRILTLPATEQRQAAAALQKLVHARQAERPAIRVDAVTMAAQVGLGLDPWQEEVLRSAAPRCLLNCSRQTGKSKITALLALHTITSEPGSLVLLLSPTMRQSQELFRKALDLYHELRAPVATQASSALRLELTNGSRIVSLPGQELTVRGYSGVRLLAVDEAARVPDGLYFSVRPMLAVSSGRLLALSTPFGTRGWWYQAWHSSEPWERFEVPARRSLERIKTSI